MKNYLRHRMNDTSDPAQDQIPSTEDRHDNEGDESGNGPNQINSHMMEDQVEQENTEDNTADTGSNGAGRPEGETSRMTGYNSQNKGAGNWTDSFLEGWKQDI